MICPLYVPNKDSGPLSTEPMTFCGTVIYLVEPSFGISEDGLIRLCPELVGSGRAIELKAMDTLYVGRPMRSEEAQSLAKDLKVKIIFLVDGF